MKRILHKCSLTLRHIGHTPLIMDFSNLWKHCWYRLTHASFHKVWMYVAYRHQQSLSRCITCQDVCVQQSLWWNLTKSKNAFGRFVDQESSKYHCDSVLKAECTSSIESGIHDHVAVQLKNQAVQQILDIRRKITAIIETIIFCVRQGIPRDSSPLSFMEVESGVTNRTVTSLVH